LFLPLWAYGANDEPPKMGNFAIPLGSQQPGPLVSFGQHIIDKNQLVLSLSADKFGGVGKQFVDVIPSFWYGITDDTSITVNVPIATNYKQDGAHSAGFQDVLVSVEHAFYSKKTASFSEQGSIVTGMSFPTGSLQKNPPTGLGSPGFFLGATYDRTYVDWFMFTSHGALLTTAQDNTKLGNSFFYQFGLGRNIAFSPDNWMLAWMVEATGQYSTRDTFDGVSDPDSGGNTVYVTPSLWASTKKWTFQLGVGLPVTQNLYGNQTRNKYLVIGSIGWTFS